MRNTGRGVNVLAMSGVGSNPDQFQGQKKKKGVKREPGKLFNSLLPQFSHFKNENNHITSL